MKAKKLLSIIAAVVMCVFSLASCSSSDSSSKGRSSSQTVKDSGVESSADNTDSTDKTEVFEAVNFTGSGEEVTDTRFFNTAVKIGITYPEGAQVYYTTDGSEPTKETNLYTEPIKLDGATGDFPSCLAIRAKAYYADGSESQTVTHTFFSLLGIDQRFNNIIFSLTGTPDDLFNAPDGLFYGKNFQLRGKQSERPIYVEAINADGTLMFEQGAGVRIFGAASRESSIKSLKLFARKSYDPEHGKFETDIFGTPHINGSTIDKYDKLVLRNAGNDFQFAYIRDELNQRLAAQAGYTDCEGVVPAVTYLNGEYYGLLWLHETYCDDLLKDKYGGETGLYEVIEGSEQYKNTDDDDENTAAAAQEFNDMYNRLAYSDLTDDANYNELASLIDVENYLDNYAFNIIVNNFDWPNNNYKCYRYYPAEGEETSGNADGRWRFILHDTDYCMGLYEQDVTMASYNNLLDIMLDNYNVMNENGERYSPLFVALLARADCKEYFLAKVKELLNGALSEENIIQTLDDMNNERYSEMQVYYKHLEEMKKTDSTIWSWYDEYLNRTENIRKFARSRRGYIVKYLTQQFDLPDGYFD